MIAVLIGTKAQYIKTSPVLRLMDAEGVPYRLIDSGQHAVFSGGLREELGLRPPDIVLSSGRDIATLAGMAGWSALLLRDLVRTRRLRLEIFGSGVRVCLIHGDTPTTFLSLALARRAGIPVAHLEAGLRSFRLFHPFPEEIIRILAMRGSDLLFAPSAEAAGNLARMRVRGEVVEIGGNTVAEAVAYSLGRRPVNPVPPPGYALASFHRAETIFRRRRLRSATEAVLKAASVRPLVLVLHPPTRLRLKRHGLLEKLERTPGVTVRPLAPHRDFLHLLAGAEFVLTDGGSVQEEAACLGTPCLLLRRATERPDGLGANVVLSGFDAAAIDRFLGEWPRLRRPPLVPGVSPSMKVVERLREYL